MEPPSNGGLIGREREVSPMEAFEKIGEGTFDIQFYPLLQFRFLFFGDLDLVSSCLYILLVRIIFIA